MARSHVSDLVGHGARQLVLLIGNLDEAGVDEDVPARQREGIGLLAIDRFAGQRHLGVRVPRQVLAKAVEVLGHQRIVDHLGLPLDLLCQGFAERHLLLQRVEIDPLAHIPIADLAGIVLLLVGGVQACSQRHGQD